MLLHHCCNAPTAREGRGGGTCGCLFSTHGELSPARSLLPLQDHCYLLHCLLFLLCKKRVCVPLFQALWVFLLLYLLLWRSAVCSGIFINYCGDAAKRTASLWTTSFPGPSTVLESILFLRTDNLSYFSAQVLYTSGVFLAKI